MAAPGPAPAHERAVVFACDDAYLPMALMAADQIARLAPQRRFDIVVAAAGAPHVVPESLGGHGLRSVGIDAGARLAGLAVDDRRSSAAYLRLALPEALASSYRRLLYLDADVFVQGGDIDALLDVDLDGLALGAVRDNLQWRSPRRRPEVFRRAGLPSAPYFNSGVLLIDVARYRADRIFERCLEIGRSPVRTTRLDQDLLNIALHGGRWAELSPLWNWQFTRATQLFAALEGAHVIHFIGAKKPWRHRGGELPLHFREEYRRFLAAHFPDRPDIGMAALPPHRNVPYLRRLLVRHLIGLGATSTFLKRFPSDLTVLVPAQSASGASVTAVEAA